MGKLLEIRGLTMGVLLLAVLIYAFPDSAPALSCVLLAMVTLMLLREALWPDHMAARRAALREGAMARRRHIAKASEAQDPGSDTSHPGSHPPGPADLHMRRVMRGDPAVLGNKLVADDWVPFLRTMPPDVHLWNDIATEFRGLHGARLDAVFWVLEQPECDRATAWHFISGAALWELLAQDGRWGYERLASRWSVAVTRWNAGFYRHHALPLTGPAAEEIRGLTPQALEARLAQIEAAGGMHLPRPKWPLNIDSPTTGLAHSTRSPWAFAEEPGLYRRYKPRKSEAA